MILVKDTTSVFRNMSVDPASMEISMLRLASILYSLIATTLAGTAIIAVLTAGFGTLAPILAAAVAGAMTALPVTYFVARALYTS